MKAVEDKDAPDVIVGNFNIFDTLVHALIDSGSTHSYVCTSIPSLGSLPKSETKYVMSKKLIEFLVHFSDFSYNIIAYFYAEICTICQIYILYKFKAEVKTDQGHSRSRQRIKVMTKSDGKANKNCCDIRELAETKTKGTSRKILSQHRFEVATKK